MILWSDFIDEIPFDKRHQFIRDFFASDIPEEQLVEEAKAEVDPELQELIDKYGYDAAMEYLYPNDSGGMTTDDWSSFTRGLG